MNPKRKPIRVLTIIGIFILLLIFLPALVGLYTDWLWFNELTLQTIFVTELSAKLLIGFVFGFIAFLLLYLNTRLLLRFTKNEPFTISVTVEEDFIKKVDISGIVKKSIFPVTLFIGFLFGVFASSHWHTVLQYLNQTPFNSTDPLFARDIGFYVFSLPFFEFLIGTGFSLLFVAAVLSLIFYFLKGTLLFKKRNFVSFGNLKNQLFNISKEAKIHLSIFVALWFLLTAIRIYLLRIPGLLYSTTGPFVGASFTDIYATLPFLKILTAIAFVGFLATLWSIRKKSIKLILISFGVYIAVAILGGGIIPSLLQNFIVTPNELVKETPYITNHIEATQKAWGLDNIEKLDLAGGADLTLKDIQENQTTTKNIRLWDRGPLLDTFGQIQEIRTYYDFASIDDDRYMINDEYRQILLSPRELNSASLPERNFINEHLTFTHGMGLTLSPVNEVTEEGLPVLFVKDLPPQSPFSGLEIERPGIYFGEMSNDYVVVNTDAKEFDYPSGEENVFTNYEGTGGVPISNLIRKAIFAWKFNTMKILLSNDINSDSKILYNRNIHERVRKAFPFLDFDADPYMVIADGKLMWIYDAHTISNRYPYSKSVGGSINYMRNSAKIAIDAYNGDMTAYIADSGDPIIQTFSNIFPGVFEPLDKMPENLRAHLKYPEDIFTLQTALYATYHMEQPQIFYNREDQWEIPTIKNGSTERRADPIMRHLIMKLPNEQNEEFIFMLPYTPRGKDNMSAWMVARNDGENYGKLVVYRFSKQALIFGPKQIVDRMNQDADISRQLSLWDQRGSEVIQGNLFVIPINEAVLYVRPLYIRAENGRIPELKRVIVTYNNKIVMEATLDLALNRLFGAGASQTTQTSVASEPASQTNEDLIRQASTLFDSASQAQRQGNWSLYGEEMQKLEDVLKKLAQ